MNSFEVLHLKDECEFFHHRKDGTLREILPKRSVHEFAHGVLAQCFGMKFGSVFTRFDDLACRLL